MFRLFQKHREKVIKYLMVFFLSIVSLSMVLLFTPLGGGDDDLAQTDVLASVYGNHITTQDLMRLIDNRLRASQLSDNSQLIPVLANTMLDDMILQEALVRQAQQMGLEVSNQELSAALQKIPWLYPNGHFVGMAQYQNIVSQQMGTSTQQFEDEYRQNLLMQKIRGVVSDGVTVTPAEVREEFDRQNAKAKIQYVIFDPSKFLKAVKISDQDLENFFKKDPSHYEIKEQRQVRYVLITPDDVRTQVNITDAQLKQYYTDHLADYRVPDRVRVAHILFKTTGKSSAEVKALQKTAQDVLAKIKAGANFADMAKKYSEDTSASNGGEIGWVEHGQTVQAFDTAAFSMKPGEISGLIHTEYGIHIIKVLDKQTAHLQTFNEVEDSIRSALSKQQIAAEQQAYADKLDAQFKAHPDQFESIARQAGLEVKESPLVQYSQTVPDFGSSEGFRNLTFQLRLNEVGQPITVPKGTAFIQLIKIVPAHVPTLDEVRDMVEEDYRAAQSKVLAHQKATTFAEQVKTGDFNKVARAGGYDVQESKDFTRQDPIQGIGSGESVPEAFSLEPGQSSGVLSLEGNDVMIHVVSHTPADEQTFASQQEQIREELLAQKQNVVFEIYRQNLKQQLLRSGKLKLNESGLKTFIASYQRE